MTKLGWGILALIVAAIAVFSTMVRFGGPEAPSVPTKPIGSYDTEEAVVSAPATPRPMPTTAGLLTVPVAGVPRAAIRSSWGEERGDGARGHEGTDIMAPAGTPVIAAAPGTVEKLFFSEGGGGITLYVRSPDRRLVYYYAHLGGYAPGVHEGMRVKAGDPLGYVGDTGNAGAGNYHLHFGVHVLGPAESWYQGRPIDPYPLLAGKAASR